jgi:type VI secretion system protein VasD
MSRSTKRFLRAAVVVSLVGAGAAASFVACKSEILPVKEPKRCTLQTVGLTVLASDRLNPTNEGEPRPVILRIYQLKNDVGLQNAKFEEIWQDDKTALGDDLVKVDELAVYPNSRSEVKFERDDSAGYVVPVALFRNPKGRSWYTVFELPPSPAKGECGVPECTGDDCEGKGAGAPPTPRFVVWLDENRVDAGDEHLDDFPSSGRVQVVQLGKGSSPTANSGAAKGAAKPGSS